MKAATNRQAEVFFEPPERREIRPQPGPQTAFLSTSADIAVAGGGAGGGKTFGLLLEPTRHLSIPRFKAVVFRRTTKNIKNPGGLKDESLEIYTDLGGRLVDLEWRFPQRVKIILSHMEHVNNKLDWNGAQVPLIMFDQLEEFESEQFWYLFSRARSTTGIRGYIRATCNPDPDSFLAGLMAWWIDQETGYAIPERSGVIRYFVRHGDKMVWGASREELFPVCDNPETDITSFTFIPSTLYDNKILMAKDPTYLSKLKAMGRVDQLRLLGEGKKGGNWKVRATAGMIFNRGDFKVLPVMPADVIATCRYWDRGASEIEEGNTDPSWTAGVKMSICANGIIVIEDVIRDRLGPAGVRRLIVNTASQDGSDVIVGIEQDPGAAGKAEAYGYVTLLQGYNVALNPVRENKGIRAGPLAAQAMVGNVVILPGEWNEALLTEMHNFNGTDKGHADQVDACSGAFHTLTTNPLSQGGVEPVSITGRSHFKGR